MTIYRPHRGGTTKMNTGSGKDIVLPEGELFVEYSDDGITAGKVKFKLGDGVSTYSELPYAVGDTSTDPIEFTPGSQSTIEEAINDISSGSGLDTLTGATKQALSLCKGAIDTINNETIPNLQSNFQAGVNSVYDAVVAKGVTPASKSLSDVVEGILNIETVTIHTETFIANNRASNLDMGELHSYRYVDTTGVPNTNSGTYTPTTRAASIDMGSANTYRYVDTTSVPNSNSATYPVEANGMIDMEETNDYRYLVVSVPNSNSATYPTITANNNKIDMGATNDFRYLVVNVPNTNSATYNATSNGVKDMGATNDYRYVNVQVPNSNSTTYSATSNGVKDMGAANDYRYVNVQVPNSNSGTYTPTTRAASIDMGSDNSYRYVNTNSVPNSNSGTYSFPANDTGGTKDLGTTNTYRYVNAGNVYSKGKADGKADHSATYTASSRGASLDMGQTHSYRYVNTNSVPNSNSGTYTYGSGSTGGTVDMGSTNSYRYVNASNVYSKGVSDADGRANPSSTNWKAGQTNGLENCKFINRFWKVGTDTAGDYSYTFPRTGYYVAFTYYVEAPRFSGSVSGYGASDIGNGWWCSWWWAASGASMTITKSSGAYFFLAGRE